MSVEELFGWLDDNPDVKIDEHTDEFWRLVREICSKPVTNPDEPARYVP